MSILRSRRKKRILFSVVILTLTIIIIFFVFSSIQLLKVLSTENLIRMEIDRVEILGTNARVKLQGRCAIIDIYISLEQALAIEEGSQNITGYRPSTHDIISDVIEGFGIDPLMVRITELKDGTYYAELILQRWNSILILDIRPSDAIAIAARMNTPIYVNENLVTRIC